MNDFADNLFVVDEAHRFVDYNKTMVDSDDPKNDEHYEIQDLSSNWRNTLIVVISILRFYNKRMRLIFLTATPMINSDNDFYKLMNVLIYNDGYQHEEVFSVNIKTIEASYQRRHEASFAKHIQGRLSYFTSDIGNPKQIKIEDMFYNMNPHVPCNIIYSLFHIVLFPMQEDAIQYVKSIKDTPSVIIDQSSYVQNKTIRIPYSRLARASEHPNTQLYIFVILNHQVHIEYQRKWFAQLGEVLHFNHTLILIGVQNQRLYFQTLVHDTTCHTALYKKTTQRHPLYFNLQTTCSIYNTNQQPIIYAKALNNRNDIYKHVFTKETKYFRCIIITFQRLSQLQWIMRHLIQQMFRNHCNIKYPVTL